MPSSQYIFHGFRNETVQEFVFCLFIIIIPISSYLFCSYRVRRSVALAQCPKNPASRSSFVLLCSTRFFSTQPSTMWKHRPCGNIRLLPDPKFRKVLPEIPNLRRRYDKSPKSDLPPG